MRSQLTTLQATGTLPPRSIDEHYPKLASWMIVLAFFLHGRG